MRLEVRCCCNPGKLLGWLDVPDTTSPTFRFFLQPPPVPRGSLTNCFRIEEVVLEIAYFYQKGVGERKAFKDNGLSIETLRRIPGFIEAKPVKFRHHRSMLDEAMKTVFEVVSREELVNRLNATFSYGMPIRVEDIEVKPYGFDERIGWETYIVTDKGNAIGFTNGPLL